MQTKLQVKNIVFVGFFEISKFDKYFFIKNNIVEENEILEGSRFDTIGGIQIFCQKFDLVITNIQLVISSKLFNEGNINISEVADSIIKAANITNLTAFGINFHWWMEDIDQSLPNVTRELFYNSNIKLFSTFFNEKDSVFGLYASKDFKNSRLKLDVKPGKLLEKEIDVITFTFNFHFDIKNKSDNSEVFSALLDYDSFQEESEKMLSIYK